ncbi:chorismate mutase [Quadrisphaera sp. DSM 44207]|uniref:chorismate mutase n=1 Tax=Quadrisphaera sp. DSM 44207 TaxID=1881057 RepID=UPI00087E9267|nr:chorismate mutase [Quadrisphaera sp. DSM 44207]SDQ39017.1 chorismate mutase [Quadrisphaera sp. DSM 44207]
MALRAVRGAVQLDADEREHLLASTRELVAAVMSANGLHVDDLVSIQFTCTPDLHSEFPAVAARELGMGDVPLMCSVEVDVAGALPRVVRLMALAETPATRAQVQHVYLRGAAALRRDIAQ